MLAASLGAKVLSFDLQVYCIKVVTQLLREKNPQLLPNIEIVNLGLGTPTIVSVPNNTCEGEFGQNGVPKAGSVDGAGAKVTVSIVDPKHVLQTWARQINLVKIDTEGAEADILAHLLPLVEAGKIQHIVAELMPSQWANRGSSLEAGLATMKKLAAQSTRMVLLHDSAGFTFPREQISLSGVTGELFEKFNVEDLVKDRKNGGGCNVWWSFY
ncbi:hypothetical protein HYH03_018363 [Edaphochlamys debaryana]|uniref:Methyltransferase FkbM domain-containing protein n=1 Tax=Edaphochlamys debaryana TaxID=47281 RepID=A0A835XDY1_9CHLO|nr:hypothetical protein HYH03_018363 [Edaphochlamys debaryana]|eukprot:KAG2482732.1 hypothetical protein HYH03_018363 [Edaphochlamys debaryana]